MNKLLTVIIPIYNTDKYLERCIGSCVHPEVNIVAIDDGSTDNSLNTLECLQRKYSSIEILHGNHQGAVHARRVGLAHVNTKYFSFVDSDDKVRIKPYMQLCRDLDMHNIKVGNGRMTVYLPGINIPFTSRKWKKDIVDFLKDKKEFSNTTCSFLDKIFHYDTIPLLDRDSKQTVYEDMEFVYYVLAKNKSMLHSNSSIYEYHMRGIEGNSTSAIGLNMDYSNGVRGLLSAGDSMVRKFQNAGIYEEFQPELEAIMIKLFFQRIHNVFFSSTIENKEEMAYHMIDILNSYLPGWQNNPYYREHFQGSEYNDYLFYLSSSMNLKLNKIDENYQTGTDTNTLLEQYDKKIKLHIKSS